MRLRALTTLLVGVGLAGASVFLVQQQLTNRGATGLVAAEPPFKTSSLVVAAADLVYGNRIGREHLRVTMWPADSVPEGGFSKVEDLLGDGSEDRIALRAITRGEPVLADKVSGFGARATLSTKLEDGKRAFSIRINDVTGVAGFLLPGDRVDVLLTRQPDGSRDRNDLVADVILQNVVVLGIDQVADESREKPTVARTATVGVTPEEAQKLALAMEVGTLSFALRNIGEAEAAKLKTVRVSDLVDGPVKQRALSAPAGWSVRVRRGSEVSIEQFSR